MNSSAAEDMKENFATESGKESSIASEDGKVSRIAILQHGADYLPRMLGFNPEADYRLIRRRIDDFYKAIEQSLAEPFDYASYGQELLKRFEGYCSFLVSVFEAQDQPPKHYDASRSPKLSLTPKLGPSGRGPPSATDYTLSLIPNHTQFANA